MLGLTVGRTPRTPTGSAPLFKFTDPELSRQASTVKERLLQWCQMKTKEYEVAHHDDSVFVPKPFYNLISAALLINHLFALCGIFVKMQNL